MASSLARSAESVGDGEVLDATDEGGGGAGCVAGELEVVHRGQQLLEEHASLQPGQVGAEAVVGAEPEGEVLVVGASDVEAERVLVRSLFAVGRQVCYGHGGYG